MWIEVSLLVACRAIDVADGADKLPAMQVLSSILQQCGTPSLVASSLERGDVLADAALRLWNECVPAIALMDAEACAQTNEQKKLQSLSKPAVKSLSNAGNLLQISLHPKTKADGTYET